LRVAVVNMEDVHVVFLFCLGMTSDA
jgi:hypothetical protein